MCQLRVDFGDEATLLVGVIGTIIAIAAASLSLMWVIPSSTWFFLIVALVASVACIRSFGRIEDIVGEHHYDPMTIKSLEQERSSLRTENQNLRAALTTSRTEISGIRRQVYELQMKLECKEKPTKKTATGKK